MRSKQILVICALVAALPSSRLGAQGVPPVSLELTGGSGSHTLHTAHLYYREDPTALARVSAALRLGRSGAVRPVLMLDYSPGCSFGWGCGEKADCPIAPDGSCREWFSDPNGNAVGLGLAAAWLPGVIATVGAGVTHYSRTSHGRYVDANVSVSPFPHVALVGDARRITALDWKGDRVWFAPLSLGVRVY